MISHSSVIPLVSKTLFRTSSPSPSNSAAVAPPGIDQKIGVHRRHLRPAQRRARIPASSITFHAFRSCVSSARPGGGKPGRVAKGRAGRAVLRGLGRVALGQLLGHPRLQRLGSPDGPSKHRLGHDGILGQVGVAIGKGQIGGRKRDHLARPRTAVGPDEMIGAM
jgi:hypothetical protein